MTGDALDDYAAQNAVDLFDTRVKVVAMVEDVADHIDHAVKIAGIDHVGIGRFRLGSPRRQTDWRMFRRCQPSSLFCQGGDIANAT